ncbi:MAG: type II secretion system protein [Bacilli bacterium]|nr:type II secretion system protein [Bacilli bacterium]
MKKKMNFTFIELLLSITCIIVIGLLIIPFISRVFILTEKKVFTEYIEIINEKTLKKVKESKKDFNTCYIYDISKDLDLKRNDSFKGYTVYYNGDVYLFIQNESYYLSGLKYINKDTTNKNLKESKNNIEVKVEGLDCQHNEYIS